MHILSMVPALDLKSCAGCATVIANCQTCAVSQGGATTCTACTSPNVPALNMISCGGCNTCTNAIAGTKCSSGYVLSSDGTTCSPGIDCSVIAVNTNSGMPSCTTCASGYGLPGTSTTACYQCTGSCTACTFDSNFNKTCSSCSNSVLTRGVCVACSSGTFYSAAAGACVRCSNAASGGVANGATCTMTSACTACVQQKKKPLGKIFHFFSKKKKIINKLSSKKF